MTDFVTWQTLATQSGCLMATIALTAYFKSLIAINPRIISCAVAISTLILATVFTGGLFPSDYVLCLFNGIFVGIAASGGVDGYNRIKGVSK